MTENTATVLMEDDGDMILIGADKRNPDGTLSYKILLLSENKELRTKTISEVNPTIMRILDPDRLDLMINNYIDFMLRNSRE